MNIFLIGYRCTGKTSVGNVLAKRLEWSFADSDAEVMEESGISIYDMVSHYGWDFFREREREVIKRLCTYDKYAVATGGGAVVNPDNVKDMQQNGVVVWLRASPDTISMRILQDEATMDQRPSLTSQGLLEEIEDTLVARIPLYESAMDFYIDTDRIGINDIADIILNRIAG